MSLFPQMWIIFYTFAADFQKFCKPSPLALDYVAKIKIK